MGGWFGFIAVGWFLNPKFEIRNPKQIRMFKIQMFQTSNGEIEVETCYGVFGKFENSNFVLVSDFVLRISDLIIVLARSS